HADFLSYDRVYSRIRVIGSGVCAERGRTVLRRKSHVTRPAPVHDALAISEFRVERREKPNPILLDWTAERESRKNICECVLLRLVVLISSIGKGSSLKSARRKCRIISGIVVWRSVPLGGLKLRKHRPVVCVAAFLHDHVDDAT